MSRRPLRLVLVLAAPVLTLLALRAFCCDVYRVDSGSMEPTLHGDPENGERVLVRYARNPRPARFDLVVLRRPGERAPFIKRVVGLPGERVQIQGGDLLIDGARLPSTAPRPPLVAVFDPHAQSFAEEFRLDPQLWTETAAGWLLDDEPSDLRPGHGEACYRHQVTDGFPAADGTLTRGLREVGDVALESAVRLERAGGELVWSVTEGGDRFEARCADGRVTLVRTERGPEEVLAEAAGGPQPGSWTHARLANIDGVVSFDLGELHLQAAYQAVSVPEPRADPAYRHLLPRACLGGGGVRATFAEVRLWRDLHYTELGTFASAEPLELGPREIFVLGDNSAGSADGREWGAVRLDQVIGFAEAVVWPPAQVRRLRPVAAGD